MDGLHLSSSEVQLGFETPNIGWNDLKDRSPHLKFVRCKQVHGADLIYLDDSLHLSETELKQADAMLTSSPGVALAIQTADCLPILVSCPDEKWIGAIHAGWRGIFGRIIPKVIQALVDKGCNLHECTVWIGPHIGAGSFEVESEVADQLVSSVSGLLPQGAVRRLANGRRLVSLLCLARSQLSEFGISSTQIKVIGSDTFTDLSLASFRREKSSRRQWSWIARSLEL